MKRRILAALAAIALGAGMLAAGAGPAAASPQLVAKHVALGDSIAAGQGGGAPLDACLRTDGGYAAQLDQEPKFNLLRNAACTGATIADVDAQLAQVNRGTTVVTLTVGANDLGLDHILAACQAATAAADPAPCTDAIAQAPDPQAIVPQLTALIGRIAQRAPNATIVVTGYPHLLAQVPFEPCLDATGDALVCFVADAIVDTVNDATDALNAAIQVSVNLAAGSHATYASVVQAFAGHGVQVLTLLPPGDPWFGTDPVGDPAGFLHPTYQGYSAYAGVILAALGR